MSVTTTRRVMPRNLNLNFNYASIAVVALLVFVCGLFFVNVNTSTTQYDYGIYGVEQQISELSIKKEDLAVEKARLTSIAMTKNSAVAMAMEDATVSGYAAD